MPKWLSRLAGGPRLALAVAFLLALSAMAYGATQKPLRIARGGDTASVPSSGSTSTTGSGSQTTNASHSGTATTHAPTLKPSPSPTAGGTPTATAGSGAPAAQPAAPPTAPPRTAPPPPPPASRGYDHIFFVIDENHSRVDTLVSGSYLAGLANANAQSTTDFAIGHPSEPNYVALISGSTNGVNDDGTYNINAPNIADRIEASGRTWKGYMESMPSPCFTGDSGPYARKHNPFISFTSISGNPARCARIVPFTQLGSDLASASTTPNFVWITPNLDDDMHDGSVAQGDAWAAAHFPAIFNSPAWKTQHSLFIFTNDEDDGGASNNVPLFMMSSDGSTKTSFASNIQATHYSVLRTIEALWGLSPVGASDAAAGPMTDLFTNWQGAHTSVPTVPAPPASAATGASAVGRTGIRLEAWWYPDRARLGSPTQLI
jgi:hypothetical protein